MSIPLSNDYEDYASSVPIDDMDMGVPSSQHSSQGYSSQGYVPSSQGYSSQRPSQRPSQGYSSQVYCSPYPPTNPYRKGKVCFVKKKKEKKERNHSYHVPENDENGNVIFPKKSYAKSMEPAFDENGYFVVHINDIPQTNDMDGIDETSRGAGVSRIDMVGIVAKINAISHAPGVVLGKVYLIRTKDGQPPKLFSNDEGDSIFINDQSGIPIAKRMSQNTLHEKFGEMCNKVFSFLAVDQERQEILRTWNLFFTPNHVRMTTIGEGAKVEIGVAPPVHDTESLKRIHDSTYFDDMKGDKKYRWENKSVNGEFFKPLKTAFQGDNRNPTAGALWMVGVVPIEWKEYVMVNIQTRIRWHDIDSRALFPF